MAVGIITGSGTDKLADFEDAEPRDLDTPWGVARVTAGRLGGEEVLHVSRHGEGHVRLSNHVAFRANAWALREAGARAVVGCTACGAVDPSLGLGELIVFDDLHFPTNRLPGGEVCTLFAEPGGEGRGHWIIGPPFSGPVRDLLVEAAREVGRSARDGGCYGHVDGPRFNTRTEIRQLAGAGVTAVSQTGGPETVLFGELELPYALVGYATDYANGVRPDEPTPVEELIRLLGESTGAFTAVLRAALPRLGEVGSEAAPGTVYRFG